MVGTRPDEHHAPLFDLEDAIGSDYETGLNKLNALLEESGTDDES